jgi:hypothetical protein
MHPPRLANSTVDGTADGIVYRGWAIRRVLGKNRDIAPWLAIIQVEPWFVSDIGQSRPNASLFRVLRQVVGAATAPGGRCVPSR